MCRPVYAGGARGQPLLPPLTQVPGPPLPTPAPMALLPHMTLHICFLLALCLYIRAPAGACTSTAAWAAFARTRTHVHWLPDNLCFCFCFCPSSPAGACTSTAAWAACPACGPTTWHSAACRSQRTWRRRPPSWRDTRHTWRRWGGMGWGGVRVKREKPCEASGKHGNGNASACT